ncbi:ATP-dependent DNA helicase 2 subunit KU70 [Aristolochia californica]|uniref:ATP-dependent DNA helicase 2 subunit KU70 n=1 Tax=Aristolochia californica TaxID=171875 RepID=UPI0035DDD5B0
MDYDPEDLFRDDDEDNENEFYQLKDATKELAVYLIDASPKMFMPQRKSDDGKEETHFHIVVDSIVQMLRTQIINRSYDEIAVVFFNTRKKKNLQDLNGVYVFNVPEREELDRSTARLIKEFTYVGATFVSKIGSQYGIISGSRENSLYNAIWVGQALLRKGSTKNTDKRILILTNEDDPFGGIHGMTKTDMTRTTIQRAKDAQDLGISIELLPLSGTDQQFNISLFYADLLGLEGEELAQFIPLAGEKFQDMKDQLRKRMFKKRRVRRITFSITEGISIELNTYALFRPALTGAITWLDSVTNIPLKSERSYICADTGALLQESVKRFHPYRNGNVIFSVEELAEVKRLATGHLRLLGFKPLSCLKDYHNLRPSTFLFPSDEEIAGSSCVFVALHRSMLHLKRFAVAFYGSSAHPQLVAIVAQDEIATPSGQVEPPGMHMIYLPYSDDIRHAEEVHTTADNTPCPRATDDQIEKAAALLKRVDLKDFSVSQFANPALQRHYAVLEAFALGEDEMPQTIDETLPDEEGMSRPGIVKVVEEFKTAVYGENHDQEEAEKSKSSGSDASKKRKAVAEQAAKECTNYNWDELADSGKLKDLTVVELKYYLTAHNLPVAGKKEALISRILTNLGK